MPTTTKSQENLFKKKIEFAPNRETLPNGTFSLISLINEDNPIDFLASNSLQSSAQYGKIYLGYLDDGSYSVTVSGSPAENIKIIIKAHTNSAGNWLQRKMNQYLEQFKNYQYNLSFQ